MRQNSTYSSTECAMRSQHDISRSLYLGDKASIVRSSRSAWRWGTSGSCDQSLKWMTCCPAGLQTNVRHKIFRSIPFPEPTSSVELRREFCWKNALLEPCHSWPWTHPPYTVVRGISLQDRCRRVLEEVQFLAVRDCLLTKLDSRYSIRSPY